jgi:hypothetical protein
MYTACGAVVHISVAHSVLSVAWHMYGEASIIGATMGIVCALLVWAISMLAALMALHGNQVAIVWATHLLDGDDGCFVYRGYG